MSDFKAIAEQIFNVAQTANSANQLIKYSSYLCPLNNLEDQDLQSLELTGCEVPIYLHWNERLIHAYTKSKVLRSYLILIAYLVAKQINWQDWFTQHKLNGILTPSRRTNLELYSDFLANFSESQILDNFFLNPLNHD